MDNETNALLSELARGVRLTFANAEDLCREGILLRENGATNRAFFLHQISLEECGKIEIIGAWATNIFLGGELDTSKMTTAIRSHEVKNYANAHFEAPTPAELEARRRGDMEEAIEAFRQFQAQFHNKSNTAKNASLYVDFSEGRFVAPDDVISESIAAGIAAANEYFLGLTAPKVRMLERMTTDDGTLRQNISSFTERIVELKQVDPDNLEEALGEVLQQFIEANIGQSGQGG